MTKNKRQLLERLIHSLRNDSSSWEWSDGKSYIAHDSGLQLWVYSGEAKLWRPDITFGFIGWLRLRTAFRTWRRLQGRSQWREIEEERVSRALAMLSEGGRNA